ncbi:hypothetical protein THIOKS13070003 [Thiocapsa sp. KS1]|nr:hypothetical protein [Thiocapsa sp. KS1]CRI66747.1 hypothetical protein THIOKS13070003 [Thiocapsa sp. KS1]
MARAPTKTATLTLRVDPQVKDLLAKAARTERRSLANMLEVMVIEYCRQHGAAINGAAIYPTDGSQ